MRHILFVGDTQATNIQNTCQKVCIEWINNWRLPDVDERAVTVEFQTTEILESDSVCDALVALSGDNPRHIDLTLPDIQQVKVILFGKMNGIAEDDSIAESVALDALENLALRLTYAFLPNREITGVTIHTTDSLARQNEPDSPIPGRNGMAFRGHCCDSQFELKLCHGLVGEIIQDSRPERRSQDSKQTLSKNTIALLEESVGQNTSQLDVSLDLGTLSVATLNGLAVGDIVSTDTPLETPFSMKLKDKHIADAYLGQHKGHKAVTLSKANNDG